MFLTIPRLSPHLQGANGNDRERVGRGSSLLDSTIILGKTPMSADQRVKSLVFSLVLYKIKP
jgi:hypothetical protein